MKLKRALLPVAIALAAVVCTAPAAQADVYLTDEGQTLQAGTKITATSNNLRMTLPNGLLIECGKVTLHFELIDPGPDHLQLKQLGQASIKKCILYREALGLSNLEMTVSHSTIGVGEGNVLTVDTWGAASTETTFMGSWFHDYKHELKAVDCHFNGTLHFQAGSGTSDELELLPSQVTGWPSHFLCSQLVVHGRFTLEAHDEDPVFIHYEETP